MGPGSFNCLGNVASPGRPGTTCVRDYGSRLSSLMADLDSPDALWPGVPGGGGAGDKVRLYGFGHIVVEPEEEYAVGCRQAVFVNQFPKIGVKGYKGAPFLGSQFQQVGVSGAPVEFGSPVNVVAVGAQGRNGLGQHIFIGQDFHTERPRARSASSIQALRSSQVKLDSLAPVAL